MPDISVEDARDELLRAGITGPHRSHGRAGSVQKIQQVLEGDPDATFGLSVADGYSAAEVLAFMSELTGCPADIADLEAEDLIDPDLTVRAAITAASRLRDEAARGATIFAGTGHPTGMLECYMRILDAYVEAGGRVVRPREEEDLSIGRSREAQIRYVGGVGCLADWGSLKHTHRAEAMEAALDARPWPDIVLADHGFAGAAIERNIATIAIMDINDHALALAWAERPDLIIVPLDDNRPPRLYEPLWRLFRSVMLGRKRSASGKTAPDLRKRP